MDEKTVDKIFAGNLEDLPPVSSKIVRIFTRYAGRTVAWSLTTGFARHKGQGWNDL